mmetsp:Transcript_54016/g.117513  ORF Transcript_54016/g.117513 Transcript_54016/m.117513 type:complete len:206 (-) Transcript_54016:9-626(-)
MGALLLHLLEESGGNLMLGDHDALATAVAALLHVIRVFGSSTSACVAQHSFLDFKLKNLAEVNVLQVELEIHVHVRTPTLLGLTTTATCKHAKKIKRVMVLLLAGLLEPLLTVLIINPALFFVGKNLVSVCNLGKLILCFGVARLVRVIFQAHSTVGPLDCLLVGITTNSQYLVEIFPGQNNNGLRQKEAKYEQRGIRASHGVRK